MPTQPDPPRSFIEFTNRYPGLAAAWNTMNEAGEEGPLDARTRRLVKIGIAIGAMRSGAVRSGVRKALAMGIDRAEIDQVVALAASHLGMPSTVAVFSWVRDAVAETDAAGEDAGA